MNYIESLRKHFSIGGTTAELIKFVKETNIPVNIGGIIQNGNIAGPKFWSIWVDTVFI
jgi:predicted ATP-dependent serine protease